MSHAKDVFWSLFKDAPIETLMMSRRNCHCLGVDSVVVKNDGGRLTRAFFASPNSPLNGNTGDLGRFVVGPHTHKYDIKITPLFGLVYNVYYGQDRQGFKVDKYAFSPDADTGEFGISWSSHDHISERRGFILTGPELLKYDDIHSMRTSGRAAWLVEEGPQQRRTTFLWNNESPKTNDELYQPFKDVSEIKAVVEMNLQ